MGAGGNVRIMQILSLLSPSPDQFPPKKLSQNNNNNNNSNEDFNRGRVTIANSLRVLYIRQLVAVPRGDNDLESACATAA